MKLKSLVLALSAFSIALPFSLANHHEEHEEHTPLEDSMSEMNKAWKKIRRSVEDPAQNADTLKQLALMKTEVVKGLDMTPARKDDVPADQQKAFMEGYVKEMKALAGMIGKLETLVAAGDNASAAALVKEINDHRKAGHKEYKRPDDD